MPFAKQDLLSVGRVESVTVRGRRLDVVLRIVALGGISTELLNPRNIVATVDDIARTQLDVRSLRHDDDALHISMNRLPPNARSVNIRIEGLIPGRDEVTVSLERDATPFDPGALAPAATKPVPNNLISYLFKDFQSFRQLMLDSLSHDVPRLSERHEADQMMATVEVLAYAADHLSYFQDAVATEAYLDTARRRVSVRRHARLINYVFHEGCTPRTWLHIAVRKQCVVSKRFKASAAPDLQRERRVYETLESAVLYPSLNNMTLWDYADPSFAVVKGATAAMIVRAIEQRIDTADDVLGKGSVLIFELHRRRTGAKASASVRQAVRLTKPVRNYPHPAEPGKVLTYVEWDEDDALTFDFPARVTTGAAGYATFVLGNIVAADFGETVADPIVGRTLDASGRLRIFAPQLTYAVPYDAGESAKGFLDIRPYRAVPQIGIRARALGSPFAEWQPRQDLIGANPYDRVFTVERELTGSLLLRFGDGSNGSQPDPLSDFEVAWRCGNGTSGRVGPDAIREFDSSDDAIISVRNPLASRGGFDPMDIGTAKRQAPTLVRKPSRCITDEDFVAAAESVPGVRAAVKRRWTGSGQTVDVYVYAGERAERIRDQVKKTLQSSSAIGVQVAVREPRRAGVVVQLAIRIAPGANPNEVMQRVVATAKTDLDTRKITMGKSLFASWFIAAATKTADVSQATLTQFRRLDDPPGSVATELAFEPTDLAVLVDEFGMVTGGRPLVVIAS